MKPPKTSVIILLAFLLAWGAAGAQTFDAERYLGQCLKLEAGGDLTSARESCRNALRLQPDNTGAGLALGRLELQLGNIGVAEDALRPVRDRGHPEADLLLAEAALARGDAAAAASFLAGGAPPPAETGDMTLAARHAWLSGRTAEEQGRPQFALGEFRRAAELAPAEPLYHRAAAATLMRLGLPDAAVDELLAWRSRAGVAGDAELQAELAQALWAAGRLRPAAAEFESAVRLTGPGGAEERAANLRSLAAVRLGAGDPAGAAAAFSEALRHGNVTWLLSGNRLFWILTLFGLLAGLLLAEGRRQPGPEMPDRLSGTQQPGPGRLFAVLLPALLLALAAVLLYGGLVLGNFAALFAPIQGNLVRAIWLIVFSVSAALFSMPLLRRQGAAGPVAGSPVLTGLGLGAGLLVLTLVFLNWAPAGLRAPWQVSLERVDLHALAAVLLLPLSEVFFRALALPVFTRRYGRTAAVPFSAALYALVLGTPVVLSLLIGAAIAWTFSVRLQSGTMAVTAQLVLQLGILAAAMLSPGIAFLLR